LESSGTPATLELDNKKKNTLPWGVLYTVGKALKCRCRKWPRMSHLDICSTSYGRKKGRESNWQFDSRPQKVVNRPDLGVCRWSATHCWKALEESYKITSDLIPIRGLSWEWRSPKVPGVQTGTISGLLFGNPGNKSHLDAGAAKQRRVNPLRGGRQQPLQSLEKSRKYKGGSKRHEMAASPSPKIQSWSHSALKACSMSNCLS
jgi:hypothetical protein